MGYVRDTYKSLFVMFENKNVEKVELEHINQTANYLGARLGMLGFVTTRKQPGDNIIQKIYAIYNDTPSIPRKTILILTDEDIKLMIRLKQENNNPATHVQKIYRRFQTRVQ
ncbi:hypothetical protein KDK_05600 [Dictyobacter kobayashii]|uniref:Uncharacterized protein n=1 Tax=Dictyobacter kobayashii TaxID=2014872 RepID=A0A402ACC6_9CHLR|nr:hypothetical protein KDK_05600 [Dictyobacter kobayashii]